MGMSRRKEKGNPLSTCVWTSGTSRDRMSLSSEWHGQGLKGLAARNGTADLANDDLLDPVVDGQNYLITTNHATKMSMGKYPLRHWVRVRMLPGPSHNPRNSYQPGANDPQPGPKRHQEICKSVGIWGQGRSRAQDIIGRACIAFKPLLISKRSHSNEQQMHPFMACRPIHLQFTCEGQNLTRACTSGDQIMSMGIITNPTQIWEHRALALVGNWREAAFERATLRSYLNGVHRLLGRCIQWDDQEGRGRGFVEHICLDLRTRRGSNDRKEFSHKQSTDASIHDMICICRPVKMNFT